MKVAPLSSSVILLLAACTKPPAAAPVYEASVVEKRDIVVSAQAAGSIAPDTIVEVKSKASGEVLNIMVETGQLVRRGTLMVSIDRRVPENDVATAQAALDVAQSRLDNAQAQLARSKELYAAKVITEQEFQNTTLDVANAKAEVIRSRITLDNVKIALGDTDVLAPITGTVIRKTVERGAVISSPTRDVGGGSVLLTMADLSLVQVRTFVDETDIGKLRPGMEASVTVQAYPNRPFNGTVLKIEPQADTIQNVVMFPVLVRIDNTEGLLKPGMSATVKIAVGQRIGVLAIPNGSLRTEKDAASAGSVLGITEVDLKQMLADAKKSFDDATAAAKDSSSGAPVGGARGGAAPAAAAGESAARGGGVKTGAPTTTAMAGGATPGAGRGGAAGGRGGAAGGRGGRGGRGGGGGGFDAMSGGKYIVFTMRAGKPVPVYVQTGMTDLDYSEVKRGLAEGDSVLMLPSASMIQGQQQALQRSQRMSGGLPGQANSTAPAGGTGGGAAAGGGGAGGGGGGR